MSTKKIKSVSELSRYKPKETVWHLRYRDDYGDHMNFYVDMDENIEYIDWEYESSSELHPKDNFKIYGKKHWPKGVILPKLPSRDFVVLMRLLISNLYIVCFQVKKIRRSSKTGEFYYKGKKSPWMPESCLFDTKQAAEREVKRQTRLIKKWLE